MRALRALAAGLVLVALMACDDGVLELALVAGGALEVHEATPRDGVVVVLDGELLVARAASLRGTVVVLGGQAQLDGVIEGDVIALAGSVRLGADAHVGGDLAVASAFERHPRARVDGTTTLGPAVPETLSSALRDGPSSWGNVLLRAFWLALIGLLAARFAPRAVDRLGEAVRRHALTAGALGTLAFVVGAVLLVVMAFTVVLIPVSLLGLVVGVVALLVGWSAVGIALGTSLAQRWRHGGGGRSGWRERLAVALGVFGVVLALGALERVPWVGALLALGVTAVGLGAVLLTGFGTRRFVPDVAPDDQPGRPERSPAEPPR